MVAYAPFIYLDFRLDFRSRCRYSPSLLALTSWWNSWNSVSLVNKVRGTGRSPRDICYL